MSPLPRTLNVAEVTTVSSRIQDVFSSSLEWFVYRTWTPTTETAERLALSMLSKMQKGRLTINVLTSSESHAHTFGVPTDIQVPEDEPVAEFVVRSPAFWLRLISSGSLGFAEAFMYGDVDITNQDMFAVFNLYIINKSYLTTSSSIPRALTNPLAYYLVTLPQAWLNTSAQLANTSNTRSNVAAHYDISNDMFATFLSTDMTYSCGVSTKAELEMFDLNLNQLVGPLFESQLRKLRLIISKANIETGHRVLEVGTAAQTTGCKVDTLTLSSEQAALARERIHAAGLDDLVTVHLFDYRLAPLQFDPPAPGSSDEKGVSWRGLFDRFVAIEMVEHVGKDFLPEFFHTVGQCLKPKGHDAVGVIQLSTLPEARMPNYINDVEFIQKWLFPGCFVPSVTQLVSALEAGTTGDLIIDSILNIGNHYGPTLRAWRERFEDKFDVPGGIRNTLLQRYPDLDEDAVEVFCRKWLYFYIYSEFGFTEKLVGVHILRFTREGNKAVGYVPDV
ncbi:S-adenosyl-L-methionine-dependent methyltransferase [Clavulina sp. PMI_390]|nr:S-adenosyl-L-methionine-dependent methyltransferase [Clavulina sp. PMI_390]